MGAEVEVLEFNNKINKEVKMVLGSFYHLT